MPSTADNLQAKAISKALNPTPLQVSISPNANTVTALITVPSGSFVPPGTPIFVTNTDTSDKTFQCFFALAGATHAATQAIGRPQTVQAGQTIVYPVPVLMAGGDVLRISHDATNGKMTFVVSMLLG